MPEITIQRTSYPQDSRVYALTSVALLVVVLLCARSHSYLLFHSLAEMITIAFAFTIFLLAWNTRATIENDYIKVISIGFAASACIDLIHTLAFKGMNIFSGFDANLPTQLWIAARFLQALTLVAAPFAIKRHLRLDGIIAVYALGTTLLITAIFSGNFPVCYREGSGLTPFKIWSEYLIVAMIIASITLLNRSRNYLPVTTYRTLVASAIFIVCAEMAFTSYIGVYDSANMFGHLFKLAAFYLAYRAIFVAGIRDPLSVVYSELKQKDELLDAAFNSVQQQVLEQTHELNIILENAPIGISKVIDRKLVLLNRKTVDLFQYSKEEMQLQSTRKLYPSEEAYEKLELEAYPVLAKGETFETVQDLTRKDGSLLQIRYVGKAVEPSDMSKGTIWLLEDVTKLKHIEASLLESQQQLLMAQEIGSAGYWVYTIETEKIWVSAAGLQMFGYPPFAGDFPIADIESCIPESERVHQALVDLIRNGSKYNLEYTVNPADGTHSKEILSIARLESDHRGNPYKVIGFIQDITDRKRAEDNLRKLSRAVEQSPVSIVITDLNGTIEFVNPVFSRLTGYSAADAIGQNPRVLKSGSTLPGTYGELWSTVTTGKTWEGEFHNKAKDGRLFWEHAVISPLLDINGTPTHYLAVKEDITEKKNILGQLVIAKEQADAANRAKSEFLANMSHEIRTPMNGMFGMTQLLAMTDLSAEQQEYIAHLKLSGKNLLSLVNDILDLSKIEAGKITIKPAEFSLCRAIEEVYMTQKSAIFEKKLTFNITVAGDMPDVIIGDQLRFKQILLNLLGNAAKFTKQGGITITAHVVDRHFGSLVTRVTVTDTGIGISDVALDKIFKPFVQEDGSTTRQFGGTGLGLTISRRLAELMGGDISVESTQGVGSSFILRLPFEIPTGQMVAEIPSRIAAPTWDGPSLRILFVEDNPINMKFGTVLLGKQGHEVVTAENGEECLQALEQGKFDLVLMDIQMPVMNGEETLRKIRVKEEKTSSHLKVIALTAYALRGEKERFLGEGFDGYLSKPLEQQELIDEMKRVMNL